jgi:hypothetical protein
MGGAASEERVPLRSAPLRTDIPYFDDLKFTRKQCHSEAKRIANAICVSEEPAVSLHRP